jgi:hypothetical protein
VAEERCTSADQFEAEVRGLESFLAWLIAPEWLCRVHVIENGVGLQMSLQVK